MPLTSFVVVRDAASRERSKEAAVFFYPALYRRPHTEHCHRSLLRIDLSLLKNS